MYRSSLFEGDNEPAAERIELEWMLGGPIENKDYWLMQDTTDELHVDHTLGIRSQGHVRVG